MASTRQRTSRAGNGGAYAHMAWRFEGTGASPESRVLAYSRTREARVAHRVRVMLGYVDTAPSLLAGDEAHSDPGVEVPARERAKCGVAIQSFPSTGGAYSAQKDAASTGCPLPRCSAALYSYALRLVADLDRRAVSDLVRLRFLAGGRELPRMRGSGSARAIDAGGSGTGCRITTGPTGGVRH
jgi:hypothetical protein